MGTPSRAFRQLPLRLRAELCPSKATRRHASTATNSEPAAAYKIPPESPRFISIPKPRQPQATPIIRNKGVLPRPRDVHKKNSQKATPAYLDQVAPAPSRTPDGAALRGDAKARMEWRARLHASRRRALREGLTELKARQDRTDAAVARRSAARQADSTARVHAPAPDDVQFTATSVLQTTAAAHRDAAAVAHRSADRARRAARFARRQAGNEAARRTALHELYLNARSFILDEPALARTIAAEFDDGWLGRYPGRGIWDKEGVPETARWLLDAQEPVARRLPEGRPAPALEISRERQKRIAEELTGGKIDN